MDGSGPPPSSGVPRDLDVTARVHAAMAHKFPHFHPVARHALATLVRACDGWQRLFPARRASDVVPALTTWERFLSTEPRSRRMMVTVQPLGVDTTGGTWAAVVLAGVARWLRECRVPRHNQPLDVWVAELGREGLDARQPVHVPGTLTAAVTHERGGFQVVRLPLDGTELTPEEVAARLVSSPVRTLAEARRDGLRTQVVVDRASRGGSAWTSHRIPLCSRHRD